MTAMEDALKQALSRKRNADVAEKIHRQREGGEPDSTIQVRYVRCKTCLEAQAWDAFMIMHAGNPHFCRCKPGDEDLVTFVVTIPRREGDDVDA